MRPFFFSVFGFFYSLQAQDSLNVQRLIEVQNLLLVEQISNVPSGIVPTPPPPPPGPVVLPIETFSNYVPLVFVNNTNLDPSRIYVTFQGLDPANPITQQFLTFNPQTALGSFVTPSANLFSPNYSIKLSEVPQVLEKPNSYLFYVPLVTSGRAYVTLDAPMFVAVSATSPFGVQDPFPTKYTDPNYYTLLDKWEFTFESSGQSAPNLAWLAALNTSGVDFFGLSSTLSFRSYPSNNLLEFFDPAQINDGPTSFSLGRDSLLSVFVPGLKNANNGTYWGRLCLPFYSDPYNASSAITTYLRVLNPAYSMQNPPSSYSGSVSFPQNPAAGFPSNYLENAGLYGENFIQNWFNYYNGPPNLTIYTDVTASPVTYSGAASGVSPMKTLTLTASMQPTETLDEAMTTTIPFFTGANFPFMPANAVLSQYVGGTFEVGLFSTLSTISQTNLRANAGSYYSNPSFMSTPGPWYDLYAKLLHSQGLIPSYSTTGIGAVYASPYDDLLGIDSLIAVRNPTDTTTTPNPFIDIILNGGNTIPSIADSGTKMVTFITSVPGSSLKYRAGTTEAFTSISSGVPISVSAFPLQIQYASGNSPTVTRSFTIHLTYQNMQPLISSDNHFNTTDLGIINTTTIYPTDASATTFTVTFMQ